ncbi:putative Clusterin-associated protein 1 [Paratrimastix pyriformis]|uniref:Clusterin-associated protein 1 n=1 Tax=Paratrimastix pyriformis TaxID=342808 RepID=A0ABQ8UN78_9EUKA|nr:putative Clusterin-associated protein 1 [Paratrimastix pyriformis]
MSWRELRNFSNSMQILGYPYQISLDAFRTPNFELMSHALVWLIKRYDSHFTPPTEDASTEQDRVFLVRETCSFALNKLRIQLNPQKLYGADGYCVQELVKIAKVLIDASHKPQKSESQEEASPAKLVEPKNTRQLVSEIINEGAALSDLLGQERDLKMARLAAIALPMEVDHIERFLQERIGELQADTSRQQEQLKQLDQDRTDLQAKIDKKRLELERARTRMKSWQNVKPVHMEEYDKLEAEVERQYRQYVEKFRNVEWLEHELEQYTQREQLRVDEAERAINKMQRRLRDQQAKQADEDEEDGFPSFPRGSAPPQGPSEDDVSEDDAGSLSSYARSEDTQSNSSVDLGARRRMGRGAHEEAGEQQGRPGRPHKGRHPPVEQATMVIDQDTDPQPPPRPQRPSRGADQPRAGRPGRRPFEEERAEAEGEVLSDAGGF